MRRATILFNGSIALNITINRFISLLINCFTSNSSFASWLHQVSDHFANTAQQWFIHYYSNSHELDPKLKHTVGNTHSLTFKSIKPEDAGEITFIAERVSSTAMLRVKGKETSKRSQS